MVKTPEKKFSNRALKSWATRRKNARAAKKVNAGVYPASKPHSEVITGTDSPDHTSTFTKGALWWTTGRSSLDLMQIADEIKAMDRHHAAGKLQEVVCRVTADQEIISRSQMLEQRKSLDERIVCAWLAEVDYAMQAGNGGLRNDEAWVLNSLLVTKIVDALNAAGYTAKGRRRT